MNEQIIVPTDNTNRSSLTRRPAYSYGWDFAPWIVGVGIKGLSGIEIEANQIYI